MRIRHDNSSFPFLHSFLFLILSCGVEFFVFFSLLCFFSPDDLFIWRYEKASPFFPSFFPTYTAASHGACRRVVDAQVSSLGIRLLYFSFPSPDMKRRCGGRAFPFVIPPRPGLGPKAGKRHHDVP